MLRGVDLVASSRKYLGCGYVYGAKGEVMTKEKLNTLAKQYPKIFTAAYIKKCEKNLGRVSMDCSGLISMYTKKIKSSSMFKTEGKTYTYKEGQEIPIGAILWREGHVAVYSGSQLCIEARGVDYGVVENPVKGRKFTHYILPTYIDYTSKDKPTSVSDILKKGKQVRDGLDELLNLLEDL